MKISELLTEDSARIQHAEDIVFWEGSRGAVRALDNIESLSTPSKAMTLKWDGCIHPDHILFTDNGKMRIEDVIDFVLCGHQLAVLGHSFEKNEDVMTPISAAVKKVGEKLWVEISLENNETIRLTEDHEVFTTNRGWVRAKELVEGDDIKEPQRSRGPAII
jgi:hypothetical protein